MATPKMLHAILADIKKGNVRTITGLNKIKLEYARIFKASTLPKNSEIIALASPEDKKKFRNILTKKPARNSSGVTVVAVMTPPAPCRGQCIYCPSSLIEGIATPQSYTGKEPSTMRSLRFGFAPEKIIQNRLHQYREINKPAQKVELILQGGTFCALPYKTQRQFIVRCYEGIIGKKASGLHSAQKEAETSPTRIVGITIETRPDYCSKTDINHMLSFGTTRVELGVQNPDTTVYKKNKRNHSVESVISATARLKDSAFKVLYHYMPGLYGSTEKKDLTNFRRLFSDEHFCPDMLKIYPCLVLPNTKLYSLWKQKKFVPYSTKKAARVIAKMFQYIPKYVRVMRVQRDIPATEIVGGVKNSNLRQFVEREMQKQGVVSRDIRSREAWLKEITKGIVSDPTRAELQRYEYSASNGKEIFLSFEDKKTDSLFGYCRLRIPHAPFRKEIVPATGLIRELHVCSGVVELGQHSPGFQHRGFGKQLLLSAEKIAREEFDCTKMAIISGVGVREYYKKFFRYRQDGPYVSKALK